MGSNGRENVQEHATVHPPTAAAEPVHEEKAGRLPAPGRTPRLWLSCHGGSVGKGGRDSVVVHRKQKKSTPPLSPCVISADEGLWDVFAKDIPRGATSYTVSLDKLRQGVTYEFRVVAVNQAGYGEPSSPSTAVSGREPCRSRGHSGYSSSLGGGGDGWEPWCKERGQRPAPCRYQQHRPSLENTVLGEQAPPGP